MKKNFLSILVLIFILQSSFGQKVAINLGPEFIIPVGTLGDFYKAGYGGSGKILVGVAARQAITFTIGYASINGKNGIINNHDYSHETLSTIPYLLGYRMKFSKFYVEPQTGFGSYKRSSPNYNSNISKFIYGGEVGYLVHHFDFGIRLRSYTGSSYFALKAGYTFGFGGK